MAELEMVDCGPTPAMRRRLLDRVQRSAAASRCMHTRRHGSAAPAAVAPGVALHLLYAAAQATRRPGEPQRVCLLRLAAGTAWAPPPDSSGLRREWLVLEGAVTLDGQPLAAQDFHLQPPGLPGPHLASAGGALVLLREAAPTAAPEAGTFTQRAATATWVEFAPGIHRRVMWQHEGQAAMLYRTVPGASVPGHGHRHDEECLLLEGEVFLDDVLLRPLDYQLAPAGTGHWGVSTETGLLLYAHGDLELDLRG